MITNQSSLGRMTLPQLRQHLMDPTSMISLAGGVQGNAIERVLEGGVACGIDYYGSGCGLLKLQNDRQP